MLTFDDNVNPESLLVDNSEGIRFRLVKIWVKSSQAGSIPSHGLLDCPTSRFPPT